MNLDHFFRWKPNKDGWILYSVFVTLLFLQGRNILSDFCELFDYYDYNGTALKVLWLIICLLSVYKIIEYNLNRNYESKGQDDI